VSSATKKADRPPELLPGRESVTLHGTREFLLLIFVEGIAISHKIIVPIKIMGKQAGLRPEGEKVDLMLLTLDSRFGFAQDRRSRRSLGGVFAANCLVKAAPGTVAWSFGEPVAQT
jgi:hypothetical protein